MAQMALFEQDTQLDYHRVFSDLGDLVADLGCGRLNAGQRERAGERVKELVASVRYAWPRIGHKRQVITKAKHLLCFYWLFVRLHPERFSCCRESFSDLADRLLPSET